MANWVVKGTKYGLHRLPEATFKMWSGVYTCKLITYSCNIIIYTCTLKYVYRKENQYIYTCKMIMHIWSHDIFSHTYFFSADMHLGGRVIKMPVICQRVVIWLHLCVYMIAKILTFHLIPNISHLEHMQYCYKVIIANAKFCPRGNLEFAFLGFL